MSNTPTKGEFHSIITKVYDSNGECIAISSSVEPGEFEPDEATKKFWEWLDGRRFVGEGEVK